MGGSSASIKKPHFFLHRTFMGEQDLLIIFNTKRCRYSCKFCQLPDKCSPEWVSCEDILAQFEYAVNELKHSLSVLDRVTISNEGSVFDSDTFPNESLLAIAESVSELRRVRTIILETRLEFVTPSVVQQIKNTNPRAKINILTGFETLDTNIRDNILGKNETLKEFELGLDRVAKANADLTAYIIFKPSQTMSDEEAMMEATASIDYLKKQCEERGIDLTIRLNPMYAAKGSMWTTIAEKTPEYKPPRLTDVLTLAIQKAQEGVKIYIGPSTEGLEVGWGNYQCREDFSPELIKQVIIFNNIQALSSSCKYLESTSLDQLMQTGCVVKEKNGLNLTIPKSWIIGGEDRLSYTTMVRLIECCREYHWQTDIVQNIKDNIVLDSICKSLLGEFIKPILVGSDISISSRVTNIREKGYSLRFEIRDTNTQTLYAKFDMVSIFFDPLVCKAIAPPSSVFSYLSAKCDPGGINR
jgi:radical SAM enzyme (TIGR01210 family)